MYSGASPSWDAYLPNLEKEFPNVEIIDGGVAGPVRRIRAEPSYKIRSDLREALSLRPDLVRKMERNRMTDLRTAVMYFLVFLLIFLSFFC